MAKEKQEETNNPFAQLKLSNFPDQNENGQKQNNGKLNQNTFHKVKTPHKNKHTSFSNASGANASGANASGATENMFDEEENSLFFANMANVQKLTHSPKEIKKDKIKTNATKANTVQTNEINRNENQYIENSNEQRDIQQNNNVIPCPSSVQNNDISNSNDNNDNKNIKNIKNIETLRNSTQKSSFMTEQKIENALYLKGDIQTSRPLFDIPEAFSQKFSLQKPEPQYHGNAVEKTPASSSLHNLKFKDNSAISLNGSKQANMQASKQINTQASKQINTQASPSTDTNDTINPAEELNLFFDAVSDVKSLHGKGREITPDPIHVPISPPPVTNPLQDFFDEKLEFALHSTEEYIEAHVIGLDLMTVGKLQARQYKPEAHIDLHGLNCEQAYANLVAFFRNSYNRGLRTVLVVTGKGNNSINGTPILRNKAQEWFTAEPFKRVILAFCSAKIEDGGSGALYVLIRKQKKNYGEIQWDITPTDPDLFL